MRPCIFQPGNCTYLGSEGVNSQRQSEPQLHANYTRVPWTQMKSGGSAGLIRKLENLSCSTQKQHDTIHLFTTTAGAAAAAATTTTTAATTTATTTTTTTISSKNDYQLWLTKSIVGKLTCASFWIWTSIRQSTGARWQRTSPTSERRSGIWETERKRKQPC